MHNLTHICAPCPRSPMAALSMPVLGTGGFLAGGMQESQPNPHRVLGPLVASEAQDVFLPASSISVMMQESQEGLGLAMQSAELCHRLVTPAIKEYAGGKLFTLMIWLVSLLQLACRSSRGLLESHGVAGLGVLISIMLKASQKNLKLLNYICRGLRFCIL